MKREIVPEAALKYDDALSIYRQIADGLNESDEDEAYLLENLQKRAIRYSIFRSRWYLMDQMERIEQDSDRTSAHDAFISAVNMIDRYQKENTWREKLGNDRRRIGDFAGYVCLFLCLEAR